MSGGKLELEDGIGGHYAGFKAPDTALAADLSWTLPTVDGAAGQALVTDGSGILSWVDQGQGPQGLMGPQGPQGEISVWKVPTNGSLPEVTAVGDLALVTSTGFQLPVNPAYNNGNPWLPVLQGSVLRSSNGTSWDQQPVLNVIGAGWKVVTASDSTPSPTEVGVM